MSVARRRLTEVRQGASWEAHDLVHGLRTREAKRTAECGNSRDHAPQPVPVPDEILDIALDDAKAPVDILGVVAHDTYGLLDVACSSFQPLQTTFHPVKAGIQALKVLIGAAYVIIEPAEERIEPGVGARHALLQAGPVGGG